MREAQVGDRFRIVKSEDGELLAKPRTVKITAAYETSVTFGGMNITRRYLAELLTTGEWAYVEPTTGKRRSK